MVGLDAAGKTTILYKLKLGEIVTTIPTIGKYNGFSLFLVSPLSCIQLKDLNRSIEHSILCLKYLDKLI